jgi:hypothetical protein
MLGVLACRVELPGTGQFWIMSLAIRRLAG